MTKKLNIKRLNILGRVFKMKWKAFFIIFKRLSMKKIACFLEGESQTLNLTWLTLFGYETHLYLYDTVTKPYYHKL